MRVIICLISFRDNFFKEKLAMKHKKTKKSYETVPATPIQSFTRNLPPRLRVGPSASKPHFALNRFSPLADYPPLPPPRKYFVQVAKTPQSPSSSSSNSKSQTYYIKKNNSIPVAFLEHEFVAEDIPTITKKLFPQDFYFFPENLKKTRQFYEFILVDTNSIEITHSPTKNDPSKIGYSKLKILKVIGLSKWNQSIYTEKSFSQPYFPSFYNYLDYQNAWFNVLYYRPYNDSWSIHFASTVYSFLAWFTGWWIQFSLITDIFPKPVMKVVELFTTEL